MKIKFNNETRTFGVISNFFSNLRKSVRSLYSKLTSNKRYGTILKLLKGCQILDVDTLQVVGDYVYDFEGIDTEFFDRLSKELSNSNDYETRLAFRYVSIVPSQLKYNKDSLLKYYKNIYSNFSKLDKYDRDFIWNISKVYDDIIKNLPNLNYWLNNQGELSKLPEVSGNGLNFYEVGDSPVIIAVNKFSSNGTLFYFIPIFYLAYLIHDHLEFDVRGLKEFR